MTDFKKFKVLISDFDGTLVDTSLNPSEAVQEAIGKLISKGYIFSIATGRHYQGTIKKVCEDLSLTAPQIVSGGSIIVDPTTGSLLWCQYIWPDSARRIIKLLSERNYEFVVENNGSADDTVSKIVLEGRQIPNLKEIAEELSAKFPDLYIAVAGTKGSPVLDITSIKATKYTAVLELAKILNIDPKFMIGVGDGYNDYPLLSVCGFKVAMDNAPQELKEIADMVVPDVVSNGLVTLINQLI